MMEKKSRSCKIAGTARGVFYRSLNVTF